MALAAVAAACGVDDDGSVRDEVDSAITEVSAFIDDTARDASEAAARNFAALQAVQEFERAGHLISAGLDCEAEAAASMASMEIICSGETEDGGVAHVRGTIEEFPGSSITELDGEFVGTVDDVEVFRVMELGG